MPSLFGSKKTAPPATDDADDTALDAAESYTHVRPTGHGTDFRRVQLEVYALDPDPARKDRVHALGWGQIKDEVAAKVRPLLDNLAAVQSQFDLTLDAVQRQAGEDAAELRELEARRKTAEAATPIDLPALVEIDTREREVRHRQEVSNRSADLLAPLVQQRRDAARSAIDAHLVGELANKRVAALAAERDALTSGILAKIGPELSKLLDLDAAVTGFGVPHHVAAQSLQTQLLG